MDLFFVFIARGVCLGLENFFSMVSGIEDLVRKLALEDKDYQKRAYDLVLESFDYMLSHIGRAGRRKSFDVLDFLSGFRLFAFSNYGALAGDVLKSFGLRSSMDIGRVVYRLVEAGLLSSSEKESLDDFSNRFDFGEAFSIESYFSLRENINS